MTMTTQRANSMVEGATLRAAAVGRRRFTAGILMTGVATLFSSCAYVADYDHGPPPHAPAHGYRYRHSDGMMLLFDGDLGLYLVIGQPHHYYHRKHFYRFHKRAWHRRARPHGQWRRIPRHGIPPGLSRKRRGGHPPGPKHWPK